MSRHRRAQKVFEPSLVKEAVGQAFVKLNPIILYRNPVMFTVEIGTAVMIAVCIWIATGETTQGSLGYNIIITAVLLITLFGIAALFYGLYFWARRNPLPAAIVGLTLFVTLHLIDAIADPTQLARGIIMKVIIVAMLVQAIQAGVKYKRLLPQLQMAG